MIVTLINIAMFILGSIFRPDQRFGYEVLIAPLIYGVLSLIPYIIMYSKKELTIKQLYIRQFFQLISIEIILYLFGYGIENIKTAQISQTIGFGISILCVYVLVNLISSLLNVKEAKELTNLFEDFQAKQ